MSAKGSKIFDPILRRIYLIAARARLGAVTDGGKRQYAQIALLKGETKGAVERVQNFGVSSHPPDGSQAIVIHMGGNRDHPVIIAADDPRCRHNDIAPGEVVVYNAFGDHVLIKKNGEIEIVASLKVRITTPRLECTGDIIDRCETNERSVHQMREIFDEHVHPENDSGGPTDEPNQKMNG